MQFVRFRLDRMRSAQLTQERFEPRTTFDPHGFRDGRSAKILYLNYPNNPTSAIAPREYLEDIVRRCKELDILLVYDNAYSELAFDGYRPPSILLPLSATAARSADHFSTYSA